MATKSITKISSNSDVSTAAFDGNIVSMPAIKTDVYTKDAFIQECAMRIFCESDFDRHKTSFLVKRAASNARALAAEIFK